MKLEHHKGLKMTELDFQMKVVHQFFIKMCQKWWFFKFFSQSYSNDLLQITFVDRQLCILVKQFQNAGPKEFSFYVILILASLNMLKTGKPISWVWCTCMVSLLRSLCVFYVPLFLFTFVSLLSFFLCYLCFSVTFVSMFLCSSVSLYLGLFISMFLCFSVPLFLFVSLFRCFFFSLFLCFRVPRGSS